MNRVFNYFYNLRIMIGRVAFVTRLEVEDFTVAASVTATGSENLAALIAANKNKLVGFGDAEGLGIGFLVVELYVSVDTLRYLVGGVAYPNIFAVAVFPPAKRAGSTHKELKWL